MKEHVNCGGELVFSHRQKEKIRGRTITKNMHECTKCGHLINVIECPSYEEFVMMGRIRVSRDEYLRVKSQCVKVKKNEN